MSSLSPFAAKTLQFLQSLPEIDPQDLPAGRQHCPCCFYVYHMTRDDHHFQDPEPALMLPCGHLVGKSCYTVYLLPPNEFGCNTCPRCGQLLYDASQDCTGVPSRKEVTDFVACSLQFLSLAHGLEIPSVKIRTQLIESTHTRRLKTS